MNTLQYKRGSLYLEGVQLTDLANEFGTPLYVYSFNQLTENIKRIKSAFSIMDSSVCYALKANSNPTILRTIARSGFGADVVSGGELYLALENGFRAEKIVFAGVGKRDVDIEVAIKIGIRGINVESEMEFEVISEIAAKLNRVAPISLRLNPDIDIHGHPYISTGRHGDKFGITNDAALKLLHRINKDSMCQLVGIHAHLGSQIKEMTPYQKLATYMRDFAKKAKDMGHPLEYIDIGGGFGIEYEKAIFPGTNAKGNDDFSIEPSDIAAIYKEAFDDLNVELIVEPGRSIVANTGILLTEVLYLKKTGNTNITIVDAGMTELIRPSLYSAYHAIVPTEFRTDETIVTDVVGPICESSDFLARERELSIVGRGDYLAVATTGAYGFTLSSNYNARPRSAEIFIKDKKVKVIRDRQKLEDLWI